MEIAMTRDQGKSRTGKLAALLALAAAVVVALVALAACGASDVGPAEPAVYTDADNGRTVTAAVGDSITLRLSENPSTGYAWKATYSAGLKPLDDEFVSPSASPDVVGAPGVRVFTVEVAANGSQSIEAVCERPWEAGMAEPAQVFSLTIDVE
jgi:inhibitor of cysteine peptidase